MLTGFLNARAGDAGLKPVDAGHMIQILLQVEGTR